MLNLVTLLFLARIFFILAGLLSPLSLLSQGIAVKPLLPDRLDGFLPHYIEGAGSRVAFSIQETYGTQDFEKTISYAWKATETNVEWDKAFESSFVKFGYEIDESRYETIGFLAPEGEDWDYQVLTKQTTKWEFGVMGFVTSQLTLGGTIFQLNVIDIREDKLVHDTYFDNSNKTSGRAKTEYNEFLFGGSFQFNREWAVAFSTMPAVSTESNYEGEIIGTEVKGHGARHQIGVGYHREEWVAGVDFYSQVEDLSSLSAAGQGFRLNGSYWIKDNNISLGMLAERLTYSLIDSGSTGFLPAAEKTNWGAEVRFGRTDPRGRPLNSMILGLEYLEKRKDYFDTNSTQNRLQQEKSNSTRVSCLFQF